MCLQKVILIIMVQRTKIVSRLRALYKLDLLPFIHKRRMAGTAGLSWNSSDMKCKYKNIYTDEISLLFKQHSSTCIALLFANIKYNFPFKIVTQNIHVTMSRIL